MLRPGTHWINHKGHAEWIDLRDTCEREPFRMKFAEESELVCIDSMPLHLIPLDIDLPIVEAKR